MANPCTIQEFRFIHPLGDTPAVCLTEALPLGQPASILLLGCGDPRDILFTLHSEGARDEMPIDFTCCDNEPAVLARNILLFACFVDEKKKVNSDKIFQIFYHFYIDQESLDRLHAECKKLLDAAADIDIWNNSKFGKFMRMCSKDTLAQLKQHWLLYLDYKVTKKERMKIASQVHEDNVVYSQNCTYVRSTGICWAQAGGAAKEIITHFWKHGVTDPNAIANATRVNPTFVFANGKDEFSVHYETNPLAGFHLVAGCLPVKGSKNSGKDTKPEHLLAAAKAQFHDWGSSFRSVVNSGAVTIRFHIGGALEFCRALRHWQFTGSIDCGEYSAQWTSKMLALDGGDYSAQTSSRHGPPFNIIETSSLLDQVGILNIIAAASPLLLKSPSSTMYTGMSVASTQEPDRAFSHRLCCDIGAFGVLFGLIPYTYVSGFSSCSNTHEILFFENFDAADEPHERLGWKFVALGEPTALVNANPPSLFLDPDILARFIHKIYLQMFEHEALEPVAGVSNAQAQRARSSIHYTRESFAQLLQLLKAGVPGTDWNSMMELFLGLVQKDEILANGMQHYQDLCHHLHWAGVFSVPVLCSSPTVVSRIVDPSSAGNEAIIFRSWMEEEIPAFIYVVLEVPRQQLKQLANMGTQDSKAPVMQADVFTGVGHNVFSSVHAVFANISKTGSAGSTNVKLTDDPEGWEGTSPLVAVFRVPTWKLLIDPKAITVCLSLKSAPTYEELTRSVGLEFVLFSTKLVNTKYVTLCRSPPNTDKPIVPPHVPSIPVSAPRVPITPMGVLMNASASCVLRFVVRVDVGEENAERSLALGAKLAIRQTSPYILEAELVGGGFTKEIVYPFPVDGRDVEIRPNRNKGFVEILTALSKPPITGGGFSLNLFLMLPHDDPLNQTLWNVHFLRNLDRLPILDTEGTLSWEWYAPHVTLQLSDREWSIRDRCRRAQPKPDSMGPLIDIKSSLCSFFAGYINSHSSRPRTYALAFTDGPPESGVANFDFVIFFVDLRLDLAAHTIIADSCVVLLTPDVPNQVRADILKMGLDGGENFLRMVPVKKEEKGNWQQLLLVCVERCREWEHDASTCKYSLGDTSTRGTSGFWLCSCGRGKNLPQTFTGTAALSRVVPYATRAAISPLFGVSYIEPVGIIHGQKDMDDIRALSQAVCWNLPCGRREDEGVKLMMCARCGIARYCSAACQKKHWKSHKRICWK